MTEELERQEVQVKSSISATAVEKKRRKSRKSLVSQIEDTLHQIDKDFDAGNNKPSRTNLLQAKLESQMTLLKREDETKQNAALADNGRLKEQMLSQQTEIAALRQRGRELESKPVETIVMSDTSETDAWKSKVIALIEGLQSLPDKEIIGMRVFIKMRERAAGFLEALGIDWRQWVRMSGTYQTKQALQTCVEACVDPTKESKAYWYCKLRLRVEHGVGCVTADEFI